MVVAVLGEQVRGVGDLALVELVRAAAEVGEAGDERERDQHAPRPPFAPPDRIGRRPHAAPAHPRPSGRLRRPYGVAQPARG